MHPLKVLLVEDDAQLRASLTRLLCLSGYEVMVHASAESLLQDWSDPQRLHQVACILMDVNLSGLSGIDAQKRLRARHEAIPIIFISAELNAHHVNQAWRDGATEFLFKPFAPEHLIEAIERVVAQKRAAGSAVQPPADDLLAQQAQAALIGSLTGRQLQVLSGLVLGHSNTKIAQKLQISARTVKMHREGIMRRLGVHHLAELVSYYEQHKALFPKPYEPPVRPSPNAS